MTASGTKSKVVRGRWEDVDLELAGGGGLLSDSPDDPPGIETLFEQERISKKILETISAFLAQCQEADQNKRTLFIALHGSLGQGKTRVIQKVVSELDRKMLRSGRWRVPVCVAKFNCSDYRVEDLLQNFDHFLENGRTFKISAVSAFLAVLVVWFFATRPAFAEVIDIKLGVSAAVVAALLAGLASMRHLLRDVWRDVRIGKPIRKTAQKVIDRLFIRWNLLVIDDLDRATLEQQRALLHSLNRHCKDMSGVVLVAFDDAPLLSGETQRTEATEILTKVFDVSFRLSPLNANDAGAMAADFGRALRDLNPECEVAKAFSQPIVCGALARIFLLHGNASARFAKKLINNVYSAALLGNFFHEADLLALIRLHGIYRYLPVLETELDFLVQSMIESAEGPLFETIRERFGDELGIQLQTQLRNMINATHHMQPTNLGWLRTLRIWRNKPVNWLERIKPPQGWQDLWTRNWAINDALLTRLKDPRSRLRDYEQTREVPLHALTSREIEPVPYQDAGAVSLLSKEKLQPYEDYWRAMVDGLMVFDDEVLELLTERDREHLLKRHRLRPLATLLFSHSKGSRLGSPHFVFRHSLYDTDTNLEDRLRHEFSQWSGSAVSGAASSLPPPFAEGLEKFGPSYIDKSWPDFVSEHAKECLKETEKNHFRELGLILRDLPGGCDVFPLAHLDWVRAAADAGRFEAIRKAMHLLHEPSKVRLPFWHIGAQQTFWVRTKDWPDIRKDFISHLLEQFAHGRPSFTDLWMLSVLDEATLGVFSVRLPSDINLFLELLPSPIPDVPSAPTWYEELRNLANLHAPLEKAQALWKLSAGIRFP